MAGTGVLHQNTPHHLRGYSEKMGPVGKLERRIMEQLQVGFVHQGRGLQSMIGPLVAQMPLRDAMQFGINQFRQLVEGIQIPGP